VNDRLSNVLSLVVLAVVGARLVQAVTLSRSSSGRSLSREVWTHLRWRHFWPVPFVLAGVLLVAFPLLLVPVLRWGWWSALGGDGNPIFGSSTTTSGTVWEWLIPLVFMGLVLTALPLFANAEERMFRMGAQRWTWAQRVVKVLEFGLIHALIGIPIGVALALSVGGAYFMSVYLRSFSRTGSVTEATLESTRAHTAYNALIIASVAVVVAVTAVA
jgi:polyferredoxin